MLDYTVGYRKGLNKRVPFNLLLEGKVKGWQETREFKYAGDCETIKGSVALGGLTLGLLGKWYLSINRWRLSF